MVNCHKCKSSPCCCNPCNDKSMSQMRSDIDSMLQYIEDIQGMTKWLSGHPIVALEDVEDINMFDTTTGKGTGRWVGWGICDGTSYLGKSGNVTTPDLRDRFLVGSQGSYVVGSQGGANSVTLSVAEMPTHNHALTDPGHTHNVTDPGHTHTGTVASHNHPGLVDVAVVTSVNKAAQPAVAVNTPATITTNPTGVSVVNDVTGVSIASEGGSLSHENRPPYYAVLFVKKIF
jgi:microcystin-dependent protein